MELVSSVVSSSRIEQGDIRMDILGQSTGAAAPCPVSYVAPPSRCRYRVGNHDRPAGGEAMPVPLINFRRCPECRRTEIVETGEVIAAGNQRHDRCGVGVENWVYFEASADWRPA
jgi:hypothetical protein